MELLRLRSIVKSFGPVVALKGVAFNVAAGEVHALLGENGAGKSTLVKILAGIVRPDAGEMSLHSESFAPRSPQEARALGIGVVHQHDALIDALTVAENLALGDSKCPRILSRRALESLGRDAARRAGVDLPPLDALARDLSVGERQRVEIVRALASEPRVLLLDEPTAALAPSEAHALLISLREIASRGVGVVFISHYLREVMDVADRVTVLRGGATVLVARRSEVDENVLATAMVGEAVAPIPHAQASVGAARLVVTDVHTDRRHDPAALQGVEFAVHRGECVAIAGVAGNGQRALVAALEGVLPLLRGTIAVDGVELARGAEARRRRGLAIVPEERRSEGLAPDLSIAENLVLSVRALAAVGRSDGRDRLLLRRSDLLAHSRSLIERYGIRPNDPLAPAGALSGGNQQRVILARELFDATSVAVLAQPTRGLDVKATQFVHAEIERVREAGAAVLLVSTDLDETQRLADRILVMLRGRIVAQFARGADPSAIGAAMTGAATAGGSA